MLRTTQACKACCVRCTVGWDEAPRYDVRALDLSVSAMPSTSHEDEEDKQVRTFFSHLS